VNLAESRFVSQLPTSPVGTKSVAFTECFLKKLAPKSIVGVQHVFIHTGSAGSVDCEGKPTQRRGVELVEPKRGQAFRLELPRLCGQKVSGSDH